jgi:hypothetical protein
MRTVACSVSSTIFYRAGLAQFLHGTKAEINQASAALPTECNIAACRHELLNLFAGDFDAGSGGFCGLIYALWGFTGRSRNHGVIMAPGKTSGATGVVA